MRLVEFTDDNGKLYRLATNRWDFSVEEIAGIYKHRWHIELFFKWKVLELLRIHAEKTWSSFTKALHREPTKKSRGRRKAREKPKK